MGVISSALPGLSDRGGGKNENEEPAGRDRKVKREMAAKKKTGERQKGFKDKGGKSGKVRRSGGMSDSEEAGQEDGDGGGKERT